MSKVQEIERALGKLPVKQQWEVAHWLLDKLEVIERDITSKDLTAPDYGARRRRIFGDKVLPNMVLSGRAEERW